mgnify:CR=1 FL=1
MFVAAVVEFVSRYATSRLARFRESGVKDGGFPSAVPDESVVRVAIAFASVGDIDAPTMGVATGLPIV